MPHYLDISTDVHVLSPPNRKESFFGGGGFRLDTGICDPLPSEQLDGFYSYSIIKSLSLVSPWLANMNILVLEIMAKHWGPAQNLNFLENDCDDFDWVSAMCGEHLSK